MNVAQEFFKAQEALFEHVGFIPDWVEYAIDNCLDKIWSCDGDTVKYAYTVEKFNSDGDYYENEVYTQRFYKKWIYEGEEVTMIFCNPGTDGVQWFRIFNNELRIK